MQNLYPKSAAVAEADVKTKLMRQYKITNLGTANQFIRIEIHRNKDGYIGLGQPTTILTILKYFSKEKARISNNASLNTSQT